MNRRRLLINQSGFTLIEVLIAAVIAAIVVGAGFQVFINHNKSQVIQSGITNMQQNARAAVDELVHNIRRAGYLLPGGTPALAAWNCDPDTIMITFMKEPACTASVSATMTQPSAELECDGSNLGCFQDNQWAYIYDPGTDSGEFFYITQVRDDISHLLHGTAPLSKSYPLGSQVCVLTQQKYYIDKSDTSHPRLMVKNCGGAPDVYADDIEDLQFQYKMANGTLLDTITVDRYVRSIMIKLVARTQKNDLFLGEYRRDTLSTRVEVRNL